MKCVKKKRKEKSEYDIQCECIEWVRHAHPGYIVFSVPNEAAGTRANKYKRTGMLPGVSDLIAITPYGIMFIEMKNAVGRQSKPQRTFQALVEALGYPYYLCRSLEEFKSVFDLQCSSTTARNHVW